MVTEDRSGSEGCTCPSAEPHSCPYLQEINDKEEPCRCCDVCTQLCQEEI